MEILLISIVISLSIELITLLYLLKKYTDTLLSLHTLQTYLQDIVDKYLESIYWNKK